MSAAPFEDRLAVIERVGRSGFAETVAVTMPDRDGVDPGWSLWTVRAWDTGDVRSALITRERGLFYVRACDAYGFPEGRLIRPRLAHGAEGSPAYSTFLAAVEEFVGRRPNTRLRYGRN